MQTDRAAHPKSHGPTQPNAHLAHQATTEGPSAPPFFFRPTPGTPPGTTPAMPSSSSLIQGISISVSDDDEATGKVRVRVRRKRSRASASASARRRRLLFRTARLGVPLLLAALAVSLLLYESYRLTPSHSSTLSSPSFADFGHLSRAARAAGSPRKCKPTLNPLNSCGLSRVLV